MLDNVRFEKRCRCSARHGCARRQPSWLTLGCNSSLTDARALAPSRQRSSCFENYGSVLKVAAYSRPDKRCTRPDSHTNAHAHHTASFGHGCAVINIPYLSSSLLALIQLQAGQVVQQLLERHLRMP